MVSGDPEAPETKQQGETAYGSQFLQMETLSHVTATTKRVDMTSPVKDALRRNFWRRRKRSKR